MCCRYAAAYAIVNFGKGMEPHVLVMLAYVLYSTLVKRLSLYAYSMLCYLITRLILVDFGKGVEPGSIHIACCFV